MITNVNQRWRERRASYRPAGEPIDTSRFEVGPLQADLAAGLLAAQGAGPPAPVSQGGVGELEMPAFMRP